MKEPLLTDVLNLLGQTERYVSDASKTAKSISSWSIGQHIEHVTKATSALAVMVLRDRPQDEDNELEKAHSLPIKDTVLARGSFPRGLVEAPEITHPSAQPGERILAREILKCRNRVSQLASAHPEASAEHPYLGPMQRDEAMHFLAIHLRHHLSIMEDIVESSK